MNDQNQPNSLRSRRDMFRMGAKGALAAGATIMTGNIVQGAVTTTPSATEGPFWVDEQLRRTDVRSDPTTGALRQGLPLYLTVTVSKLANGEARPLPVAYVDIWHCDAAGAYSDEPAGMGNPNTVGQKWLRGFQVTDTRGVVRFTTIYPGWYVGRTPHIHCRVRTYSGTTNTLNMTTQFFFDDTISDYVFQNFAPYNAITATRGTRNTNDNVYTTVSGGGNLLLLRLAEDANQRALASFNIVIA
jgi:protocatechuate 3,4-dioxygenase beta subunit